MRSPPDPKGEKGFFEMNVELLNRRTVELVLFGQLCKFATDGIKS